MANPRNRKCYQIKAPQSGRSGIEIFSVSVSKINSKRLRAPVFAKASPQQVSVIILLSSRTALRPPNLRSRNFKVVNGSQRIYDEFALANDIY